MSKKLLGVSLVALAMMAGLAPTGAKAAKSPSTDRVSKCSWNTPGHNPFMGDVVAAVDRYQDIPQPVREKLKQRMAARTYDDIVEIKRDTITGTNFYGAEISQMHFGEDRVCDTVTRDRWTPEMKERGLVYCESGECLVVPTVCRNVSRISRVGSGAAPASSSVAAGPGELVFDAPAAGPAMAVAAAPASAEPDSFEYGKGGATPSGAGGPGWVSHGPSDGGPQQPPLVAWTPTLPGPEVNNGGSVPFPSFTPPRFDIPRNGLTPVAPVPEPSTWAMLIVGTAFIGWTQLRRRRAEAKRKTMR